MKSCNELVGLGRRQFLRGGATAAAATIATGMTSRPGNATPALARISYPSTKLANVKDLKTDNPVQIQYPDKDSPGVIIKLGRKVESGVGPDGDIVAFSALCPHKGYPLGYVAADKTLNCRGTTRGSIARREARRSGAMPHKTWRSSDYASRATAISSPTG